MCALIRSPAAAASPLVTDIVYYDAQMLLQFAKTNFFFVSLKVLVLCIPFQKQSLLDDQMNAFIDLPCILSIIISSARHNTWQVLK
jgi:hypothetical protein